MGHLVSPEMSLELIPIESPSVEVGVAVGLPPVYYDLEQLVCREKNLLTIGELSYLLLLIDQLHPVLYVHRILGLRKGGGAGPQKFSQSRLGWWWCLLLLLLLGLLVRL
jgi:hypothetical protein